MPATRRTWHATRAPRCFSCASPSPAANSLTAERLTLTGRCGKDDDPQSLRLFLARHPDAARYAGFADFSLYRFEMAAGHLVAGFGRIVDFSAAELLGADTGSAQ